MAIYSLKSVQRIPVPVAEIWDFFSSPKNLPVLTPPSLGFKIISKHHGSAVYPGQVIEYKVKPLFGISLYWMTEITHVDPGKYFVDEQRYGPYAMWHHQHHFMPVDGGVEMTDIVHYKNPLWVLGDLANTVIVRKKLREIFSYRFGRIEERFGKWPGQKMSLDMH
jgi:ligand-binding SRPBCC domain-containing protein